LSADEWHKVQSHPVIAYAILQRIPNFPKASARAVLEHHENLDGSGYPKAKKIDNLHNMGQLINLLDNSTIFKLIKMVPSSTVKTPDEKVIRDLIIYVQQKQNYIKLLTQAIQQANEDIGFSHKNQSLYSLQNIAINILVIMNSSGLGSDDIDWIEQLDRHEDQQALYTEVEDTRLMQGEITYQLQSYQKNASVFINKNPNEPASQTLEEALNLFSKNTLPTEPKSLKEYWQQLAT